MSEERCYICNRTVEEINNYLAEIIYSDYDYYLTKLLNGTTGTYSKQVSNMKEYEEFLKKLSTKKEELKKLESAIEDIKKQSIPFSAIKQNGAMYRFAYILQLSKEFIDKYGEWDVKKYIAGKECDYPFDKRHAEILDNFFQMSKESPNSAKTKIEKYVETLREEVSEGDPYPEKWKNAVYERFATSKMSHRESRNGATIPMCSVCGELIDSMVHNYF